ncbi:hypothetical protein [Sulfitobacter sp.]|uniref:hypothetical protein n=1 Tax=Sulfitobacter sp. TaxID=1903071 RepID=UPI003001A2D9
MSNINDLAQIKTALRPLSFMLLICVMVVQFVAPALAVPSAASVDEHHMVMDHSGMGHSDVAGMDHDMAEMDAHHQGAAYCMAFMCCFQETSTPFKLVASDVLLPNGKGIEQGMTLPSHLRISKDRPPQHI